MIQAKMTLDDKLRTITTEEIKKGAWIDLVAPDDQELEFVSRIAKMDLKLLKVALDEEERAHIDFEEGTTLVVVDTPVLEENQEGELVYTTMPLGILFNGDYFVTVSLQECSVVTDFQEGRIKGFFTYKRMRNMLLLLQHNSKKFLQYLRYIDRLSNRVQAELRVSQKNKEILRLMELEKSLVYFATGINANGYVLSRLQTLEVLKTYPEDIDLLDDVIVDNEQAKEMCSIYTDILSGTMDAFASIVSNNLNIVMKILAIITIVVSIPTLFASFWGMNVDVPFGDTAFGFWFVLGVSIFVTVFGTWAILRMGTKVHLAKKKRNKKHKD